MFSGVLVDALSRVSYIEKYFVNVGSKSLLSAALANFRQIPFANEEEVAEDIAALNKICCQSSHSYIYAQELLCSMDDKLFSLQKGVSAESPEYSRIRVVRSKLNRVRTELQETANSRFGEKTAPFHILRRRYIYEANPQFCDAVLSIIKTKKCSELSAEALVKEYQTSGTPPPVAHLRDPMVGLLFCSCV